MTPGRNDFPLQITQSAIAEIVNIVNKGDFPEMINLLSDHEAPYEDIQTAMVIFALQTYMQNLHVDPGFEVVLG